MSCYKAWFNELLREKLQDIAPANLNHKPLSSTSLVGFFMRPVRSISKSSGALSSSRSADRPITLTRTGVTRLRCGSSGGSKLVTSNSSSDSYSYSKSKHKGNGTRNGFGRVQEPLIFIDFADSRDLGSAKRSKAAN